MIGHSDRIIEVTPEMEKRVSERRKQDTADRLRTMDALLPEIRDYIKQNLKDLGGCDHSVGICMCADEYLLNRVLALMGEEQPVPGDEEKQ